MCHPCLGGFWGGWVFLYWKTSTQPHQLLGLHHVHGSPYVIALAMPCATTFSERINGLQIIVLFPFVT